LLREAASGLLLASDPVVLVVQAPNPAVTPSTGVEADDGTDTITGLVANAYYLISVNGGTSWAFYQADDDGVIEDGVGGVSITIGSTASDLVIRLISAPNQAPAAEIDGDDIDFGSAPL
jgi:hypothetical protein